MSTDVFSAPPRFTEYIVYRCTSATRFTETTALTILSGILYTRMFSACATKLWADLVAVLPLLDEVSPPSRRKRRRR